MLQIRIEGIRSKLKRQAWRAVVRQSAEGVFEDPKLTESDREDLALFNKLLAEAHELKQAIGEVANELDLAQGQISISPIDQWPALIKVRNEAQEKFNDCRTKTQFIATMNYNFPEFFENYIPLSVLAARRQAKESELQTVSN